MSNPYRSNPEVGRHVRPSTPDVAGPEKVIIDGQNPDNTLSVSDGAAANPLTADGIRSNQTIHSRGFGQLSADLNTHSLLEEVLEELRAIRTHLEMKAGSKLKHDHQ